MNEGIPWVKRTRFEALLADVEILRITNQGLADQLAEARCRESRAAETVDTLVHQRDVLESERNQLLEHSARQEAELETVTKQRNVLALERDELQGHAQRLSREAAEWAARYSSLQGKVVDLESTRTLLWATPGHFYSPIADPSSPFVLRLCSGETELNYPSLGGERFNESAMLRLFNRLCAYYGQIPFTPHQTSENRYYFENPFFSYADGITLFGLLCELRPRLFVEIGSGFSSCLVMDTNDRCLGGSMEVVVIDPFPDVLLGLLKAEDAYRGSIRQMPLQAVGDELFASLGPDDILFIDSSHVSKTGSDVNDYLFRIFPLLRPGTVIHIHDVFYPFEYPSEWIMENRSWNEIYLLRAFLQYNPAFEILYFNDWIYRKRYRDLTGQRMPLCLKNTGGSIWLRKIHNGAGDARR